MNVFENIYRNRLWGNGSGSGSDAGATAGYRRFLQAFLRENSIQSVVDFGCGDWQFSRHIDWSGVRYIGLDVVPDLIQENSRRFGTSEITFGLSPNEPERLPPADLFIGKDVLQHLPNRQVVALLDHVSRAYKFSLITNCVWPRDQLNKDIELGDWRPLDVRLEPFLNFAAAVYSFEAPILDSLRRYRRRRAWKKVVLLLQ